MSNLHAHLVFTPKYRRAVFTDAMLDTCENAMRKVCLDFDATLTEFNGEADHVHLLVHYPPALALSTLVGSLKGVSARIIRRDHPADVREYLWGNHFWSPSYFAASCGGAPLDVIKQYIQNQQRPSPASTRSSRP